MTDYRDKLLVEKADRIDIRYWLIEIQGKKFIIDYSNPSDLRNYFSGLFPELNTEWKIYDISNYEGKINTMKSKLFKTNRKYTRKIYLLITLISILYLLNIILFPKAVNIAYLTYDSRIKEYWKLVILLLVGILIFITLILNKLKQLQLPILEQNFLILKQSNVKEINYKKISEAKWYVSWLYKLPLTIQWVVAIAVLIPAIFAIGIISSSYSQLLFFTVIPFYEIFLGKFLGFIPMDKKNKYEIIKEKENE
ncbi:TPA: hypothetical protein ACHU7D_001362 [Enterococcus faecium]|uniref:hypothetical protein n=1 Tax=Enterococcus TaxID=1350 RepID=UPI00027C7958|nr:MULTISPECIES: hypothetical protein [Enterococcus]EGP5266626.1 hypothetical protein [Enterococcus faecium]EGP5654409.1 hypothetical protein [Enterococcus faecium]EGP5693089.1 hypothetical protein [Enterococcus faecium]EJV47420.1 hypothetical protein HMPREF1345_02070 [Enterococcus faecium TX1337RF]EME7118612.1 hypothetical protein [Enterococcus faecium]